MYLLIGDLVQVYTGAEEGARNILRGLCVHGLRNPLPPPLGWHFCLENKLLSNVISSNINLCPRPLWAVSIFQFLGACPFPFFCQHLFPEISHAPLWYPYEISIYPTYVWSWLHHFAFNVVLFRAWFFYVYVFILVIHLNCINWLF